VTEKGQYQTAFWSYNDRSQNYDYSQPEETFRELFLDSMHLRMRADVPIAVLLSGGLDSSAIALHAHETGGSNSMQAFTYSVPGFKDDEQASAEIVAQRSGINLHSVEVQASQFSQLMERATWHMEDPLVHPQVLARWQLLQAASQTARIVLEGQGADEMLGGYPKHYRHSHLQGEKAQMNALNFLWRAPLWWRSYFALGAMQKYSIREILSYLQSGRARSAAVFGSSFRESKDPCEPMECLIPPALPGPLSQQLWRDHSQLVLPYLLHFGDAISMAHSVESRLPFLDHRLVEFIFGLPCNQKIRGGSTKHILRRAFREKMPAVVQHSRKKIGFSTPVSSWIEANLESEIRPRLFSKQARERGLYDHDALNQCIADLKEGSQYSAYVIFRCLALENWCELFLDRNWNSGNP